MFSSTASAGGSEAVILKRMDGALIVQLKNPNWRIDPAKDYRVAFQIDGRAYSGAHRSVPVASGFITTFAGLFEDELQAGKTLSISRDGAIMDQLTLNGSGAALKTVQSCLADLRVTPLTAQAARPPKPQGSPAKWITLEDYPNSAIRAGRQGSVAFRLAIGRDGRPNGCTVTTSSGSSDLDDATCRNAVKRARFTPAQTENGDAIEGVYDSKVTWTLPE
jgi:TonB family protein